VKFAPCPPNTIEVTWQNHRFRALPEDSRERVFSQVELVEMQRTKFTIVARFNHCKAIQVLQPSCAVVGVGIDPRTFQDLRLVSSNEAKAFIKLVRLDP
jgi:hypothetical protein